MGVTIHEINSGIDTGPIIFQKKIEFNIMQKKHDTFSKTYKILRFEIEKLFKQKFRVLTNSKYKTVSQKKVSKNSTNKKLPKFIKDWNMKIYLAKEKFSRNFS